jgi:hypothetical protein
VQGFVRVRVTAKGAGRISTGEHDARRGEICFAEGAVFNCPAVYGEAYRERGLVEPADAPAEPTSAVDTQAIARLMQRATRDETSGCLVWQGSKVQGGYGQVTYRRMNWRTHRLIWVAHNGAVPDGMYVCHACDNPACIAIEHLFLGTPGENYADMRNKGRSRYNAKLTLAEVAEIKKRLSAGEPAVSVARDYCVRYDQIIAIKNGQAWRE